MCWTSTLSLSYTPQPCKEISECTDKVVPLHFGPIRAKLSLHFKNSTSFWLGWYDNNHRSVMRTISGSLGSAKIVKNKARGALISNTHYLSFMVSPVPCAAHKSNLPQPRQKQLSGHCHPCFFSLVRTSHHKWTYGMNSLLPAQPALSPCKAASSAPLLHLDPSAQ